MRKPVITDLMSGSQVGRQADLSSSSIVKYARAGAIPSTATPLGRLYRREDVEAWIAQRQAAQIS